MQSLHISSASKAALTPQVGQHEVWVCISMVEVMADPHRSSDMNICACACVERIDSLVSNRLSGNVCRPGKI